MNKKQASLFNLIRFADTKNFVEFKAEFDKVLNERIDDKTLGIAKNLLVDGSVAHMGKSLDESKALQLRKARAAAMLKRNLSKISEAFTSKKFFAKVNAADLGKLADNDAYLTSLYEYAKANKGKQINVADFTVKYLTTIKI